MQIFPVVHIISPEVSAEQGAIALDAGADGVYLIHHGFGSLHASLQEVVATFNRLDEARPSAFIGVNFLGLRPLHALVLIRQLVDQGALARVPDGLWADNAFAEEVPEEAVRYRREHLPGLQYLGGIAFKYTSSETESPYVAGVLAAYGCDRVDVVTTSGPATGNPPSREKVAAMREHVGSGKPLAIASGISLQNLRDFDGLADQVLVATSIETEPYSGVFDQQALRALIGQAHRTA